MARWRTSRVQRRLRLVCAAAAALLGIDLARWATIGTGEISRSDFPSLDAGGILLAGGERAGVYDPVRQAQVYTDLIGGAHSGSLPFNHAPVSAVLYAPFSGLSLSTAYHAFGLLQLVCLAGGCLLVLWAAPWPSGSSPLLRATVALAALAGAGTLPLLLQGQDDGVIALAVGAAYLALRRERAVLAGGLLGLVAAGTKPHLFVGLLVVIAARRDLRLLAGWVGGTLAALVVAVAIVGTAGCVAFVRLALLSSAAWPTHWFLGLPATATSLLGETAWGRATGGALALAALILAGWLGSVWRRSPPAMETALGGAACLSLAVAPHLLGHDLVLLAPLLVAVAARTLATKARRRGLALLLGGWGILLAATAVDAIAGNEAHYGRATGVVLVALATGAALSLRRTLHDETRGLWQLRAAG